MPDREWTKPTALQLLWNKDLKKEIKELDSIMEKHFLLLH